MNGQTTVSVADGTTAKEFLAQHDISKDSALAFIFDVPFIDTVSGRAMIGRHGRFIEDKDFNLLNNTEDPGWSNYEITHSKTGARILRDKYRAMDEQERCEYIYRRLLSGKVSDGWSNLVSTDDTEIIEEMIKQLIAIGDPGVNRRFQLKSEDENDYLWQFRDTITNAIAELEKGPGQSIFAPHSATKTPFFKAKNNL